MKRYDCLRAIAPHFGDELVVTNLAARGENHRDSKSNSAGIAATRVSLHSRLLVDIGV
jgi:hypothetical protein